MQTKQTKNQCDIFGTKLYITKLYRNQEKTKEKQTAKIIKERQHRNIVTIIYFIMFIQY